MADPKLDPTDDLQPPVAAPLNESSTVESDPEPGPSVAEVRTTGVPDDILPAGVEFRVGTASDDGGNDAA